LSDISDFLQSYTETLWQEIAGADMPTELTERVAFGSCENNRTGRKYISSPKNRTGNAPSSASQIPTAARTPLDTGLEDECEYAIVCSEQTTGEQLSIIIRLLSFIVTKI